MSYELFISLRYLRSKRKHAFISINTFISAGGVTLGVMAMMVVLAVMTGFGTDIKSRILGMNAHIRVMSRSGKIPDFQQVTENIERLEGVEAAAPFIHSQIMLRSGGYVSGAVLKGIDPEKAGRVLDLEKNMKEDDLQGLVAEDVSGREEGRPPLPGIVLGKELARLLVVSKGDELFAVSPLGGSLTPGGARVPYMKRFRVAGIFESGMYDYDASFAYVSIVSAQRLLRMGDAVHGIEVKTEDIYAVDKTASQILNLLGPGFWSQDWMQMNKNFFSALKLEKVVMFIILVLIILVAAFNIVSTLIMTVMEKTKDIAILKSMGATGKSIMKIFVMEGLIVGVFGTVLGILGGSLLCFLLERYEFVKLPSDVYYISTLPVKVEALDVALVALSAIAISFLATLYPAYQASRLEPVSALRYE